MLHLGLQGLLFWCCILTNWSQASRPTKISAHMISLVGVSAMFTYKKGMILAGSGRFSHGIPLQKDHLVSTEGWPTKCPTGCECRWMQAGHQSLFQHLVRLIQNHRLYIRERNPGTVRKGRRSFDPRRSQQSPLFIYVVVSWNRGTPKSSILVGFSIINHPFWGTPIQESPI